MNNTFERHPDAGLEPGFSAPATGFVRRDLPEDSIGLERQLVKPDAGSIADGVAQRGRHWIIRTLAHRISAERPRRIAGLGKQYFGAWHVVAGGQMQIAER